MEAVFFLVATWRFFFFKRKKREEKHVILRAFSSHFSE
jgi:hypothetical protein